MCGNQITGDEPIHLLSVQLVSSVSQLISQRTICSAKPAAVVVLAKYWLGCLAGCIDLQGLPKFVKFDDVLSPELDHHRAAIGSLFQQPFCNELSKGFSNRSPAATQLLGERDLRDGTARRKFAPGDLLLDEEIGFLANGAIRANGLAGTLRFTSLSIGQSGNFSVDKLSTIVYLHPCIHRFSLRPELIRGNVKSPLRGIVPPLVTPLTSAGDFDPASYDRLIERVIAGGVHGVFVMGSTGEFSSFIRTLVKRLFRRVATPSRTRIPVVVNVSDTCLEILCGWRILPREQEQTRSRFVRRFTFL